MPGSAPRSRRRFVESNSAPVVFHASTTPTQSSWVPAASSGVSPSPLRRRSNDARPLSAGTVPAVLRQSVSDPGSGGLLVGHADDPAEARADRIADGVLSTLAASGPTAASADGPWGMANDGPALALRRSTTTAAAPVVGREGGAIGSDLSGQITSRLGGGSPLPDALRGRMEGAFGTNLGGVRLHTDAAAAMLSRQVSARAFTVGKDVFFGAGQYRPDTRDGQRTIAHELAHTQSGGADEVHRLFDMRPGRPLGVDQTTELTTVGNRQVYFANDGEGKVVLKLEDQPIGLNQLATLMHAKVTKATTVQMKKLDAAERAAVRAMIERGDRAQGDGWAKAEGDMVDKANFGGDLQAWGRAMHVAVFDQSRNVPLVAMTMAEGKTVDALQNPALAAGGTGIAPIKKVLSEAPMVQQLGELSAVDLFLGNTDRVLSGNLGNWFYTPAREMTVIDNVNADMARGMNLSMPEDKDAKVATKRRGVRGNTARDPLEMLATSQLQHTAYDLAQGISNTVRGNFTDNMEKLGWDDWYGLRRASIEANLLAGLMVGRKRVIKTLMSSRFSNVSLRKAKKAIKSQAKAAAVEDAPQDSYYDILKARARWLSTH